MQIKNKFRTFYFVKNEVVSFYSVRISDNGTESLAALGTSGQIAEIPYSEDFEKLFNHATHI